MPVPVDRTDDAYFAPLERLQLKPGTELYLGVVHLADGVEGTRKRIVAAQKRIGDFGIATECRIARGAPTADKVRRIIAIHAEAAVEPRSTGKNG